MFLQAHISYLAMHSFHLGDRTDEAPLRGLAGHHACGDCWRPMFPDLFNTVVGNSCWYPPLLGQRLGEKAGQEFVLASRTASMPWCNFQATLVGHVGSSLCHSYFGRYQEIRKACLLEPDHWFDQFDECGISPAGPESWLRD